MHGFQNGNKRRDTLDVAKSRVDLHNNTYLLFQAISPVNKCILTYLYCAFGFIVNVLFDIGSITGYQQK